MIPVITASKIYSVLGNNNSLVPLAIKDVANSAGVTAGSYVTGNEAEGEDRFIDEFGTQAIWLFGIPVYKKLMDLALFKTMGYDHKIDVRVLKNKDIFEKAKEFAYNDKIKSAFDKVGKNQKTFKGLTFAKFALSTLLTIGTYGALTHYRHKHTEENIRKSILAEHNAKKAQQTNKTSINTFTPVIEKPQAFKNVSVDKKEDEKAKDREQIPFKGVLSEFMFSPVKNLMILDGAITIERFATSRSLQDFLGYAVKEGSIWMFMYFAGAKIEKYLEKKSETKHNKSIDLDARVIESDELRKAFHDNSLKKSIDAFANCKTDVEIYEFINKNPDNFIVQMAKKSEIVKTKAANENFFIKIARRTGMMPLLQEGDKVDTRAYIDIDEFKGVAQKLEKLHTQYENSGETLDVFLKGVKKLKRASVLKNIGSCIMALGVITPAIMVGLRYLREDKEFQVRDRIEKEMKLRGEI